MSVARTVLLMDDNVFVLDVLRAVLESAGFAVCTASTVRELEHQLLGCRPDLFVLDVQMPEMFGGDVAQVLRDVRAHTAPIVLYSGVETSALAEHAREAGVDYVSKSEGPGELVRRINVILSGACVIG